MKLLVLVLLLLLPGWQVVGRRRVLLEATAAAWVLLQPLGRRPAPVPCRTVPRLRSIAGTRPPCSKPLPSP